MTSDSREDKQDLTPQERTEFESLRRERTPPNDLEDGIVNILQNRGLIRSEWKPLAGWMPRIAIGAAVLLLGFALGVWYNRPPAPEADQPLFVLLLHQLHTQPREEAELVREYRQWARRMHQDGHLIRGQKLKEDGRILQRSGAGLRIREVQVSATESAMVGYFLIRANNYEKAIEVASSCPHLKYGGVIELRAIQPT